jgi:hypothetical protein
VCWDSVVLKPQLLPHSWGTSSRCPGRTGFRTLAMLLNQSTCQLSDRDPWQWPWPQQPKLWRSSGLDTHVLAWHEGYTCADGTVEHTQT